MGVAITDKNTGELTIPERDAVILTFPTDIPVVKPLESILATLELSLFQFTNEEIFAVEPSE